MWLELLSEVHASGFQIEDAGFQYEGCGLWFRTNRLEQ